MDMHSWIKSQWEQANLGDKRRNMRALKIAEDILDKPSSSFPQQCNDWATLKATYRFFNEEDVSFEALQQPHRAQVIHQARCSPITLFIQDGSELDYSSRDIDLGPIGDHRGHGFCLHTTLAVCLEQDSRNIIGIAHQVLWERKKSRKQETRTQRYARAKESDVWANSSNALGVAPPENLWVHIGDRGADIFEFLETCHANNHKAIVRMIQNRNVMVKEKEGKILELIRHEISKGTFKLHRRGRSGEPATMHQLQLSWIDVEIQPPKYLGKDRKPVKGVYLRVWEEKEDGLEWILFSSISIDNFEQAHEKVIWYSMRWMIEEYHKCLKTGCGVEKRYLHTGKALEAVIGMFGIIAAKLLELKYLVKESNTKQAKECIADDLLGIVVRRYKLDKEHVTLKKFWKCVAKLGGFLGRKSDGDPGWQTLWKGWIILLTMQEAIADFQKCG